MTATLIFLFGLFIIFLGTIKMPKFVGYLIGELYVLWLITKSRLKYACRFISSFVAFVLIPAVSLYTKWHFAVEKAKIKRIEKRLDKKIKSGDIYSNKEL